MPLAGMFRVIFFLPSIVPIVVLAMVYRFSFDARFGLVDNLMLLFGAKAPSWFGSYPSTQYMIYAYCIWAGLGYNVILLSGAISRLPQDLFEYDKLEGVGPVRELFQIVIPLVWPTITTTFILGFTSVYSVLMHPLMITPGDSNTQTIALAIYNGVLRSNAASMPYLTTFGLTLSLLGLPVILLARFGMERLFKDVEF
jgi:ABC-type sugar transport system permease subunit